MGLYDQSLGMYQRGLDSSLQLRQNALAQPTAVDRFMEGLRKGQEYQTQQKQAKLQELLQQSLMKQREAKAMQEAEDREYQIAQRPVSERAALADILFKENQARMMAAPKVAPVAQPSSGGYGGPVDKASIPGTAEWKRVKDIEAKTTGDEGRKKYSFESALAQMDRLKDEALRLKNHPGLNRVTGLMGAIPDIPGGEAANARAQFETLKSQVGFNVLQSLREMSKTGGALGQVSDKENEMLQNNLAALQSSQSVESLKAALDRIVAFTDGAKQRLSMAYQQPQAQTQSPSTKTTVKDGKTYYLWPSDGNWHTKPPM